MQNLELWSEFTREDVHAIFSPNSKFTPQAGIWGLQGIVRCPANPSDWVFFVTFGQEQGNHVFDESITESGVLSWQSQPSQRLSNPIIQELIQHNSLLNNIHLFLRVKTRAPYTYLGRLGYLNHDSSREAPVHFQWQLLDWPISSDALARVGLTLLTTEQDFHALSSTQPSGLTFSAPPPPKTSWLGVSREEYRKRKSPDYAIQDQRNRVLGLLGEQLVLECEKTRLISLGRNDLADNVLHVSVIEGDTAGYDILSYESDGSFRYIEVKTTQGDAGTAFFISPNELAFSAKKAANYILYRLYDFNKETNSAIAYVLSGNVASQVTLSPVAFKAEFR